MSTNMFDHVQLMRIPGFSNYWADRGGRIWKGAIPDQLVRLTGSLPRNKHRKRDYLVVCVWDDCGVRHRRMKIHRLVCAAFHGPAPLGKPLARHLDDNQMNNIPENLAWGTNADNSDDMKRNGGSLCGQDNPASKLTDLQIASMVMRFRYGEKTNRLAAEYGISKTAVRAWIRKIGERELASD